jgi:hypothetical protein
LFGSGQVSSDGFDYTRFGIVASGKDFYLSCLKKPSNILNAEENESMMYAPEQAYEQLTGNSFPEEIRDVRTDAEKKQTTAFKNLLAKNNWEWNQTKQAYTDQSGKRVDI